MARYFIISLALPAILSLAIAPHAFADSASDGAFDRKIERLDRDISDIKKNKSEADRAKSEASRALSQAKADVAAAKAKQIEAEDNGGNVELAEKNVQRAMLAQESAQSDYDVADQNIKDFKEQISQIEDREDRLTTAKEKKAANPDCPDGNCKMGVKGAPNVVNRDKENFQGVADLIKAVTPLGLGAFNTYLGYKSIQTASQNYQNYAAVQASLGLPVAAPTSSMYSGAAYATLGNAMLGGMNYGLGYNLAGYGGIGVNPFMTGGLAGYSGMGLGGFGTAGYGGIGYGGYGLGFGVPSAYGYGYGTSAYPYAQGSYIPYAGAYSTPYLSGGTGLTNYGYSLPTGVYGGYANTYSGLGSNYLTGQAAAAARVAQQNSIFASDAAVAQSSLSTAYASYGSALSSINGTGVTGATNYNIGAGIYSPLTTSVTGLSTGTRY